MITRADINDRVKEWGLREDIVEKDYVLGWFLLGIGQNPILSESWVFKGGTCLTLCFIETNLVSEELDFTLINNGPETLKSLKPILNDIAIWIYENSGIEISIKTATFKRYLNSRGKHAMQLKVPYVGPRQMRRSTPKIKLDITSDELLALKPEKRIIFHPYPDILHSKTVLAYSYVEIFAEKVRALFQRLRPRDLYDVIHLLHHDQKRPSAKLFLDVLKRKCAYVEIEIPSIIELESSPLKNDLLAEWENMLAHQLPNLPPIEIFWNELPKLYQWLNNQPIQASSLAPIVADKDTHFMFSNGINIWGYKISLEKIRFSGLNRLLINIIYKKADGTEQSYLIEPYSLRKTTEGNLLLYACISGSDKIQTFQIEKILKIEPTPQSFKPKWIIEFTNEL